jgi:hypothetical protein
LFQRLGDDAAEQVRRAHFRLLREAVAARGGHEVKSLGDGLMVVFPSAVEAVGCAVDMQQAVHVNNQDKDAAAFHIRVGLHVGEPIRDEGDYFGTPVIVAKRLCDVARGDQILASELVAGLVGGRGAFRFRPVGGLRLKGLVEAVPAVEVAWTGDGEDQPARTLPARRERRPAPRGPKLVGRSRELAVLESELHRTATDGLRCLLLLGDPGVGKSRLAGELRRVAARRPSPCGPGLIRSARRPPSDSGPKRWSATSRRWTTVRSRSCAADTSTTWLLSSTGWPPSGALPRSGSRPACGSSTGWPP